MGKGADTHTHAVKTHLCRLPLLCRLKYTLLSTLFRYPDCLRWMQEQGNTRKWEREVWVDGGNEKTLELIRLTLSHTVKTTSY